MAIIWSQKICISFVLLSYSFLFCLHWHSWSSLLKCFVQRISQPYVFYQYSSAISKSPTEAQHCLKKCNTSRIIWTMLQRGRWALGLLPYPYCHYCLSSCCPWVTMGWPSTGRPTVPPTPPQSCPSTTELQDLHRKHGYQMMIYAHYSFHHTALLHSGQFCWGFVPPALGKGCRRNWVNVCDVVSRCKPMSCFTYLWWLYLPLLTWGDLCCLL